MQLRWVALAALVAAAALAVLGGGAEAAGSLVRRAEAEDQALVAAGSKDNFIRHGAAGHVCVSWGDTHMMPFAGQSYFNVYNPNVLKLVYREHTDAKQQFLLETRQVYARWGRNTVDNDFAFRCGLDRIVVRNHRDGRYPHVHVNGERWSISRAKRKLPNGPNSHYYIRDTSNSHWFLMEVNCGHCGASCRRSDYVFGLRTHLSWQRATGRNIYGNAKIEADSALAWQLGGACGYRRDRQQPNRFVGRELISWGSSDFVTKKSHHIAMAKAGGAVADPKRLEKHRNECRAKIESATGIKLANGLHERFKTLDTDVERNIKEFIQSCAVDNYFGAPHSVGDMKELVCDWVKLVKNDLHDEKFDELRKLRKCAFPSSVETLKKLLREEHELSGFCGKQTARPAAVPKLPPCDGQDQTVLDTLEYATVDMSYLFNRGLGWGPVDRNVLSRKRVPFDFGLNRGMNVWHGHYGAARQQNTLRVPINEFNAVRVYTVMNTWWGSKTNKAMATLTFVGVTPDGKRREKHTVNLVGNQNIRDHNAATKTYANKLASGDAWEGWRQGSRVLDIQQWVLPQSFEKLVLESVTVTDRGATNVQRVFLAAITVEKGTRHAYKELPLPYNFGTGWAPSLVEEQAEAEAGAAKQATTSRRFGPDYDLYRPSFLVSSDNGKNVWHSLPGAAAGRKTVTLKVDQYGCRNLYTLINLHGGQNKAKGLAYIDVRARHLDGSEGASHRFHVVGGLTARSGVKSAKFANHLGAVNAVNVYDGPNGRADMQTWPLPTAFHSQILDSVTFVDNGSAGRQRMYVMGATVDFERAEHKFDPIDISPTFNYGLSPMPTGKMNVGPNYENTIVPVQFGADKERNAWFTGADKAQTTMQFPIGKFGVNKVYTVMGVFWGHSHNYKLARIEFVGKTLDGAPGLRHTFTVAANEEVRNWKYTSSGVPNRLAMIKSTNAWESQGHALDLQTWELPSGFHEQVLDKVIVSDMGRNGVQRVFMTALTTDWSFAPVKPEQLRLKASGDFCVGLAAKPKPGVGVTLQRCSAKSAQQLFEFFTDGSVRSNMDKRLCLTTDQKDGEGKSAGLFLAACHASRGAVQQWKWDDATSALHLKAHANFVLSLKAGAVVVGQEVHLYRYAAQTSSMAWQRSDPKNPPRHPASQQIRYKMDQRYCVEAVPGNRVQLKPCHAHKKAQLFRFYEADKTIRYAARPTDLRYCLKPHGLKRNKVAVTLQSCSPAQSDPQEWKLTAAGHVGMDAGDRWGLDIGEGNTVGAEILKQPLVVLRERRQATYADNKAKVKSTPTMGATRQRNEGLWVWAAPGARADTGLVTKALAEEQQALARAKAEEAGIKRDAAALRKQKVDEQAKKRSVAEAEAKADAKKLASKKAQEKAEAQSKKAEGDKLKAKAQEMQQKEKAAKAARAKAEAAQKKAGQAAKGQIAAQRKAEQDEKKKFAAMRAAFAKQQAAEGAQKKAAEEATKKNTKAAEAKSKEATAKSNAAAKATKAAKGAEEAASKRIEKSKTMEAAVKRNAKDAEVRMKEQTEKMNSAHHKAKKIIAERRAREDGGKRKLEADRSTEQKAKEQGAKRGGVSEAKLKADVKAARAQAARDKAKLQEESQKLDMSSKVQEAKFKKEKHGIESEQKIKRERVAADRRALDKQRAEDKEQAAADKKAEKLKLDIQAAEQELAKVTKSLSGDDREEAVVAKRTAEKENGVKGDDDSSSSSSSSDEASTTAEAIGRRLGGDAGLVGGGAGTGDDSSSSSGQGGPAPPPVPPDRQTIVERYSRSPSEKPEAAGGASDKPTQCYQPGQTVVVNSELEKTTQQPCPSSSGDDQPQQQQQQQQQPQQPSTTPETVPVATTTMVTAQN